MKVENLHKFTYLGCVNYLIVITFSLFLVHVHIVRAVQRRTVSSASYLCHSPLPEFLKEAASNSLQGELTAERS